ncbi:GGDEF domain-containing response regulator [Anoxynatronum buryatiense]|uniref:Stage 0 sporulation protein A homolog n=1 Tax=Anoxynatronum buryatiense TaxID=489973 RepID=A0AA45WSF8_9CLOT|nr:diguanylate cyclase [Anoxynatronum buryatiense]SMP37862.1 diguanylate cyclase (GGDEF) domain-containing protein [Anoxynatronum buryatiense]
MKEKKYDPLNILFVEDEKGTRERVTGLLLRRASHVFAAESALQGFDIFLEHQPQVVLTDLNLPDISGLELINRIREINTKTAVLIITAYNETEYLLEAIELGVSHFLIKPLSIEKLDRALEKIHKEYMMEQEIERQRHYTRTVLDFQDSLVMVTDGKVIFDANQRFMNFFKMNELPDQGNILERVLREIPDAPDFSRYNEEDWQRATELVKKVVIFDHEEAENKYFNLKVALFPGIENKKIISLTDVTELEHERQYYKRLAIIDPLTQIYNRVQFNRSLTEEIQKARRFHSQFALVMFDIDHFKKINDTYGHQLGDKILVELTNTIRDNIREVDIFARFGGEEFIILAPETDLEGAATLAEKLRKAVEEAEFSHGERLTCSFGVSSNKKNDQPDDLIKRVDDRLYHAKHRGRNRVCSSVSC